MSLSASIERLYDVFSGHRARTISGCECCYSREELDALVKIPLRELTRDDLVGYESLLGDEPHLRRFLPRMLELDLVDDFSLDSMLHRARWEFWPVREREAIEAFVLEKVLDSLEADEPVDLEQFSRLLDAFIEVLPRLEAMLEGRKRAPAWYAKLVCDLGSSINRLTPAQQVLLDWVLSNKRTAALEKAFFAETNPRAAALFSNAVLVLDWF